jgi:hypothetical protein
VSLADGRSTHERAPANSESTDAQHRHDDDILADAPVW